MTIESKKAEALEIIEAVGIPIQNCTPRRRERVALALLAVANLKPDDSWANSSCWEHEGSWALTTRDIIRFWNEHYDETVSSGSYDDVRRKDLILLVNAGLVLKAAGNPGASTNNPTRKYSIALDAVSVLRSYSTGGWKDRVEEFKRTHGVLAERLERRREFEKVAVTLPDGVCELSPGEHNELQKAILEEFLPRFAPGAEILYLGDTAHKFLHKNDDRLTELGFFELGRDQLPDVVAFDSVRNWLFLIEAVHSSNPISKIRHVLLEELTTNCTAPRVYVSVFKDRAALRKFLAEISWETEVWLCESPDHLIHFDGEKFFGPY